MTSLRGVGLRAQILMMLGAAILPLALVGLWLTASARRAGEQLLQTHLEESADRFAAAVETRWQYRSSDITLIAENEATIRVVTGENASPDDSAFLAKVARGVQPAIHTIQLRDSTGRIRWQSATATEGENVRPGPAGRGGGPPPTVVTETRIVTGTGIKIGTASTSVALASIIPGDSSRPLVPGSRVGIRIRGAQGVAVPMTRTTPFPVDSGATTVEQAKWHVALRTLADPPLDIAIGAPIERYVAPFEHAGRIGLIALVLVSFGGIVLTLLLATRATRPLRELAAASDAVTGGSLDRRVAIGGPSEIRQVSAAFNTMTEHLRRTLDELARRSALAAVGEFATTLSHDVRNALTAIRVDLERAELRPMTDLVAASLVSRALSSVARLESVVVGALRVAREGQAPTRDLDVRRPLEEAIDSARGAFAGVPARLAISIFDKAAVVRGDASALQQVFANLLFNAAQALKPGGQASVVMTLTEAAVTVTIADNGVGIAKADMEKLATVFFSTKPKGTGLGLPIARRIIATHGGDLTLESDQGVGTTVRVRLPLVNGTFNDNERIVPERVSTGVGVE